MLAPVHAVLLERECEVECIVGLVEGAVAGRGQLAVVEGPPGIGKTRLLRNAHARASSAGLRVLTASGSDLEQAFGFGVVRQLFERAAGVDLAGAAALAGPALGRSAPAGPLRLAAVDARFAALHGLYWLAANLAAERPLLIAVDDGHWVDAPSLRFLAYLARRLSDLPIAMLVAARLPRPGEDRTVLDALGVEAVATLTLAPLSADGVAALAAERLGITPERALVEACHQATGGNALLVEELLLELRERGSHAPLDGLGLDRIARRVGRTLSALGADVEALATAVAVLGGRADLALASELADLELDAAVRATAELVTADVFVDDRELRFKHPLVAAAASERVPEIELSRAHGLAARLLAERGAPPGVVAAHLLVAPAEKDPWAVETLREAAGEAQRQGAPELAVAYLRRALDETPAVRAEVLVELGRAEHAAGLPEAVERLDAAWRLTGDVRIAVELAGTLSEQARFVEATEAGRLALLHAAGDRELELRLLALVSDCVRMDPAIGGDEPERLIALAATLEGATAGERLALATAAVIAPADTAESHARAAVLAMRAEADDGRPTTGVVVSNLIRASRLNEAQGAIDEALAVARRNGLAHRLSPLMTMRGWVGLERGALATARDDLEAAIEHGRVASLAGALVASAAATLAVVVAEQGEFDRADELLREHGLEGEIPSGQVMNLLLYFRSRARQLQGRNGEALQDALAVGHRYEQLGLRRAVPPWRSDAAILLGGGERGAALAREELELAERWDTPLARARALRGLGLVTHDLGKLDAAARMLEPTPHRLELARVRVDLGAALRRAGRRAEAREPLRLGLDAAHACGALPLVERARIELRAAGARPRRHALAGTDALTPSEARVAQLAASGRTNRQIAQELFVTTATVETHLRHAFRKLDIRTRGDLAAALSRFP